MNKKIILLALIPVILLGGLAYVRFRTPEDSWVCQDGQWVKHGNPSSPMPSKPCIKNGEIVSAQESDNGAGIANPASKNCQDKGGQWSTSRETAGTLGICKFSDGSECEEWQFFRGECMKGQFTKADTSHPYLGKIKQTGSKYIFTSDAGVEYTLQMPANMDSQFKIRLTSEMKETDPITIIAEENPPLSKTLVFKSFQEK